MPTVTLTPTSTATSTPAATPTPEHYVYVPMLRAEDTEAAELTSNHYDPWHYYWRWMTW
jgi:hypothetical protein